MFKGWKKVVTNSASNEVTYYYEFSQRLSSKKISHSAITGQDREHNINLILQEDDTEKSSTITINDLPAGFMYVLNLFSSKELNQYNKTTYTYTLATVTTDLHYDPELDDSSKKTQTYNNECIMFATSENVVYNPYNTTLSLKESSKLTIPSGYINGESYLKNNTLIDYEVFKFIYNANNVNASTYSKGYVDFKHPVTKKMYRFPSKLLMQKYLNTENVSKIAFKVDGVNIKGATINYGDKVQYQLYDVKLGKEVSSGLLNNNEIKYLNNIILYDLTQEDKIVLASKYNNIIDDNFINGYLLKNKLIFSLKNGKDSSWLNYDCKFTISWKPYYEDTLAYLDFNQNGQYDDTIDVRQEIKGEILPYYSSSVVPISNEAFEAVPVEYEHIIVNDNWNRAQMSNDTITLDDLIPCYYNGWFQLCLYKDGEPHITK